MKQTKVVVVAESIPQGMDWTKMPECNVPVPIQISNGRSQLRLTQNFSNGVSDKICSSHCTCSESSGTIRMPDAIETVVDRVLPCQEQTYNEWSKHPDFLKDPSRNSPPKHWKAELG